MARNIELDSLFELFLVSAVTSILGIRLYLRLAGYPQLGGGGLHIAHMLWGGLLMLLAIALLLTFLNNETKRLAAVIGGLGFGTFIDELGKFVTSDNDYFFQPTVALIYVFFVFLYLAFRTLQRRSITPEEYLINSIELLKEAVLHGLDQEETRRAILYLSRSDPRSPITKLLLQLYQDLDSVPVPPPNIVVQVRHWAHARYMDVVHYHWFCNGVIAFFLVQAAVSLLVEIAFITAAVSLFYPAFPSYLSDLLAPTRDLETGLYDVLSLLASAVSGGLIIIGAWRVRFSRLEAYGWFKNSLLVSIFVGQVFTFYSYQFGAVAGLLFNILLLSALNYMIYEEREVRRERVARQMQPNVAPALADSNLPSAS